MARVFSFEAEAWAGLDLLPLPVRRRLDLSGWKLSLEGWRSLPFVERRTLADQDDIEKFRVALLEMAARAGVVLKPMPVPAPAPWCAAVLAPEVLEATARWGAHLDLASWAALDDDDRFALHHLAKRAAVSNDDRLRVALVELGLVEAAS